jgi:hypothetical protein
MRIYPKIQRIRDKAFLYLHRYNNGKHTTEILKVGESVVIEGGPSTGKTSFLQKTIKKLEASGEKCIFINATLPVGDWVREYKLFGKNLEARIDYFTQCLPDKFYLVVDNAERLSDSRKFELILLLLERARSAIIGCTRFAYLNPKLKVRLNKAKIHSLGTGADTFDITYFVLALMIVVVALLGAHHLIFLAAAFRYMFQGTRIGGKK